MDTAAIEVSLEVCPQVCRGVIAIDTVAGTSPNREDAVSRVGYLCIGLVEKVNETWNETSAAKK